MSLFRSMAHIGNVKYRSVKDGTTSVTATITLPAGHVLTTTNTLRFFQVGAGQRIHDLTVFADELDTGTNTLTLNVGFLSHNTGVTASNATAYAAASAVGQAGGTVRFEPAIATPAANYTVQIVPAANANANTGVKRITVTATISADRTREGATGYRFGRAAPAI